MKFIFLLGLLHFSLLLPAQESIIVKSQQQNTVYLGIDNSVSVFVEGCSCASLSVSTDNGKIEKSGCYYYYHPLRLGETSFIIYKKQNGKSVKLKSYKWYVIPLPKPIAAIGPYENGSEVPKGDFCAQAGISAFILNGIDIDYRVYSYSLSIMRDSTIQFSSQRTGNSFDEKIHEAFKAMQPGSVVLIANIWVIGADGKAIKVNPLEYLII